MSFITGRNTKLDLTHKNISQSQVVILAAHQLCWLTAILFYRRRLYLPSFFLYFLPPNLLGRYMLDGDPGLRNSVRHLGGPFPKNLAA